MNKVTSTNLKWVIPTIIIVAVLVLAIALNHNDLPYELSGDEILKEARNPENMVDKSTLGQYAPGKTVFIDLRQPLDYNLSHAENAINIPAEKILTEDYLNSIKDIENEGNTIVLYCNTPQKASGAWMLLKQVGIENIRYFNGTFEQLMAKEAIADSKLNETPVIDTTKLNKKGTGQPSALTKSDIKPKTVVPQRMQPAAESGGGC
ncbi:MAG TPA: rhodanese-like domain-containing protein [Lentimicrobium sp.]|nr:rhodanese-like domain-containing protein [Lentimicrobium sp.]